MDETSLTTGQNRIRVAVVEDNDDARELLSVFLSDSFDVVTYRNAEEALPRLIQQTAHVILVDMRLPELDGIGLLELLRKAGVVAPMIMVTANVFGNVEAKALAAGFSAFVAKPILDMQALVDQIHRLSRDFGSVVS